MLRCQEDKLMLKSQLIGICKDKKKINQDCDNSPSQLFIPPSQTAWGCLLNGFDKVLHKLLSGFLCINNHARLPCWRPTVTQTRVWEDNVHQWIKQTRISSCGSFRFVLVFDKSAEVHSWRRSRTFASRCSRCSSRTKSFRRGTESLQ